MARIAGVNLPKDKRLQIALTYIHGIGRSLSLKIIQEVNLDPLVFVKDLAETELSILREHIGKFSIEGELRRKVGMDIKRLQEIGSYRGFRHRRKLPCRGQQTKTNARTRRGKKQTMGSGRRKETKT